MKLELIKVKNFKSYKGTHTFGPLDDFSAIIGENGTGKSNLFDAICFVLGGNSSAMRCQNLTNLIWNGKPQPKSASVSLTLLIENNIKNPYITIKRKITSNSNSLFLVNGEKKSASEYKNILTDIGFPPKFQSYVIFQGDIQQIALMKPKELTMMIEELSGSIAFKENYEKSEIDYNNIQDEVSKLDQKREEIANKKRNMKKEAQETIRWKELDERMISIKKELIDFQLFQSVNDLKIATKKVSEMEIEIQRGKNNIDEIDESIQATEGTIQTMQKCNKKSIKDTRNAQKQLQSKKDLVESLNAKKSEIDIQINKLSDDINDSKQKLNEEKNQKDNLEKIVKSFKAKNSLFIENKENLFSIQDNLATISTSAGQNQKKQEIEELNSQIQFEKDNKSRFTNQIRFNDQILAKIEEEINSTTQIDEPIPQDQNISNEMSKVHQKIENLNSQIHQVKQLSYHNKKIERLSNMIHALQQNIPNVYGFVRDLCRPVRSKYELAFSAALTYHLDEVIVKDFDTACQCIEFCKLKNLGSCTFLPLNGLRFKKKDQKYIHDKPEVLTPLIEILEFDERDRQAIEYASKGIYFCETPKDAIEIYRTGKWKKIVDINGTIYNKNGMITGGNAKKYYNTNKSLEALKNEKEKLEEKSEDLRQKLRNECEEYQTKLNEYEAYRNHIQLIQNKKSECINNLMHLNQLLQDTEEKCTSYESKLQKLNDELNDELSNEEKEIKDHIQRLNKENKSILKKFKMTNVNDLINAFKQFLMEENEMKEAEKQLNYLQDSLLKNTLDHLIFSRKEYKAQLKTLIPDLNNATIEAEESEKKYQEEVEKMEKASSDFDQAKKEKSRLISMKNAALNELTKAETTIITNKSIEKNANNDLEYLLTQISTNETKETVIERDFSKTSTLSDSLMKPKLHQQKKNIISNYNEKINKMKEELDSKQPNFKAEESYHQLKESVKKIDSQLDVKRKEMMSSGQKFRSIKRQRHLKFMQTFDILVESIQDIYAKLTRNPKQPLGGTAFLSPMSPQCPFLDGIIYSVLPPLKRLRTINALSGGEQTLAVVSLIFALNEAKPAPCFILDEIDAALDKRNTKMLSTFLKSESANRQIIIVSHKDRIYDEADSLVGICKNANDQTSCSFLFKLSQIINNYEKDENELYEEPETFISIH